MEENQINHKAYNYVCVWSIQWRILVNFENFKIHIETYLSVLMATSHVGMLMYFIYLVQTNPTLDRS